MNWDAEIVKDRLFDIFGVIKRVNGAHDAVWLVHDGVARNGEHGCGFQIMIDGNNDDGVATRAKIATE